MAFCQRILSRFQRSSLLSFPHRSNMATAAVSSKSIQDDLNRLDVKYKKGQASLIVSPCPNCSRPNTSAYLYPVTGNWSCQPCKKKGSWSEIFDRLSASKLNETENSLPTTKAEVLDRNGGQSSAQHWSKVKLNVREEISKILNIKKIADSVLERYSVQYKSSSKFSSNGSGRDVVKLPSLVFHWYHPLEEKPVKCLREEPIASNKESLVSVEMPSLESDGVFGWNAFNDDNKIEQLIITDNELDAMAAHQGTGYPSIAMTIDPSSNGPSPQVLQMLEKVDKIFIWSSVSNKWASKLSRLLSNPICYVISSPDNGFERALDLLNNDSSFEDIITRAKQVTHKSMLYFRQLKNDVYSEFSNADKVAGVKWKRFSELTKLLKGCRPGEMTIFTGSTGSGKTTLMSELSLDLCQQGVSTLWGSFEISNVRLVKIMLRQMSGENLEVQLKDYNSWANEFQRLPMHFMDFHGQVDIKHVIDVMRHTVEYCGVQHVVIDNLQFMVGATYRGFDDSYHAQNAALAEFRQFATGCNVHVTIVCHPRKEDEEKLLTTASIFGTAKAGQEADNVLILQALPNRDKFLQVTKNRFSGSLGKIPLKFDRNSLTFSGTFQSTSKEQQKAVTKRAPLHSNPTAPLSPDPLKTVPSHTKSLGKPHFLKPVIPSLDKSQQRKPFLS